MCDGGTLRLWIAGTTAIVHDTVPRGAPYLERFNRLAPAELARLIDFDFAGGIDLVESRLLRFAVVENVLHGWGVGEDLQQWVGIRSW